MGDRWDYWEGKTTLRDGNVKILEMLEQTPLMSTTAYLVKYLCCGGRHPLSHHQIRKRIRQGEKTGQAPLCPKCAQHARKGKPINSGEMRDYPLLEIPLPTWDPPNIRPPKGWMPR